MARKAGLGRGLDALLPQRGQEGAPEDSDGLSLVPVASIAPNPRQPREDFDQEALEELTASIRELGVLQPLLLREVPGGYELVAGERRFRASQAAGLDRVPAMIIETDDRGSLERALVENIHRADLNPIEEAAAYQQLIDEGDLTQEALADRIGKNRVTVTTTLRLLDLPTDIQRLLVERKITAGHGRALLGLEGNPFQARLAARVAAEGISVRETRELVGRYQTMSPSSEAGRSQRTRPPEVTEAQRRLADHLRAPVRVEMGKRKGRVVVDFTSLEELDRLLEVMTGGNDSAPQVASPGHSAES